MSKLAKIIRLTFSTLFMATTSLRSQESYRAAFNEALAAPWQETFSDSGQEDWRDNWFIDGHKATLKNTPEGLFFAAGPIAQDNGSHAVLWTKESFEGDLKLEFNFTVMDTVDNYVCIVYLYASGAGPEPYVEDIAKWSELRQIPYMKTYFDHMNLLHISFAVFDNKEESTYIRARRYPRALFGDSFQKMALEPDFSGIGLFKPGVPHHLTVIKRGDEMFMNVRNPDEDRLFCWDLTQVPPIERGGRIGLRHMWQRAALYKDITVSQIPSGE